ncbi:MAG TPA: MFS transporter [Candidatus Binataceae bacterium]|nr:MFS transporter [Candidatus Binataceae bacterium]
MKRSDRKAWIIAAGLFVSLFFLWGGGYNTSPIFLDALLKAFGWSHSMVSWMPAVLVLAVGITGPLIGWLLDRVDARIVMGGGAALTGASLIAASRATSFNQLLVAYLLLGVGLGASAWLPASVIIANWFGERRGTALGLATAGMETGGMVMAFTVGHIISVHGWRAAYLALSIPVLVLVLPFLALVVRSRPENTGEHKTGLQYEQLPGLEPGEAIRTRSFWMLIVAQLAWGLSAGAVIHIVAYLTGIGYTLQFATLVFGVLAGLAALGKPIMGFVGDRVGGKNALGIALLLIAVSHIMLLGAEHEWLLLPYLLVVGISIATPTSLVPLVLTEVAGLRRFGTIYGWIQVFGTLGLFGGPLIAGQLYDFTHNYAASFEFGAMLAIVGAAASFLCAAPRTVRVPLPIAAHG